MTRGDETRSWDAMLTVAAVAGLLSFWRSHHVYIIPVFYLFIPFCSFSSNWISFFRPISASICKTTASPQLYNSTLQANDQTHRRSVHTHFLFCFFLFLFYKVKSSYKIHKIINKKRKGLSYSYIHPLYTSI